MVAAGSDQQIPGKFDRLLPTDLLGEGEVVVFAIKPSVWMIVFFSFPTVVAAGALAAAVMIFSPHLQLGSYGGYLIWACSVVGLGRLAFAFLQWLSRTYVLTDRRVIRVRGVFTIDVFECLLSRIQNTFMVLTLPQRLFRLGDIVFTTAGTGSVEAIWNHCKNPLEVHRQVVAAVGRAAGASSQQEPH